MFLCKRVNHQLINLSRVLKQSKRFMDSVQNINLLNIYGKLVPGKSVLKGKKYVMYYFSASWCAPCQFLLPKMKQIHEEILKRKIAFEIVYVPLDTEEEVMMKYFKENHGNWYAVPFEDMAIDELRLRFGVTHIPYVVVIKSDGTTVSTNAKKEIDELGVNVLVTWID